MVISFQQEWVKRGCSDIGIIADAAKAGISDKIISLGKPVSTEAPKLRPRGTVRTKINVRIPAKRVRKIRIDISFWTDEPVWHIMTIRRGLRKETPASKGLRIGQEDLCIARKDRQTKLGIQQKPCQHKRNKIFESIKQFYRQ